MIWILTIWISIGIYAFYLELTNIPINEVRTYYETDKVKFLLVFFLYCVVGALFLLFGWLEERDEEY